MKKLLVAVAILSLVALTTFAGSKDTVIGSPHDIKTTGCLGCHTPHGTTTTPMTAVGGKYPLLWARALPTTSYTTWSSGTLSAPASATDVGRHSYMCMSCHDGSFTGNSTFLTGTSPTNIGEGAGSQLQNDHPVHLAYPTGTGFAPATSGAIGTAAYPLYSDGTNTDFVECSTCHNPHDQNTTGPGAFLRTGDGTTTNKTANVCVTCHI